MSLILEPSFKLVGYNVHNHWANREVTRVTGSLINHVGFRLRILDKEYETYITTRPTDTLVPVRKLQKLLPRPRLETPWTTPDDPGWVNRVATIAEGYGHGNVIYPYLYHYLFGAIPGAPVPKSCTDLAWRCLKEAGLELKERFYPNQLISEGMYSCM